MILTTRGRLGKSGVARWRELARGSSVLRRKWAGIALTNKRAPVVRVGILILDFELCLPQSLRARLARKMAQTLDTRRIHASPQFARESLGLLQFRGFKIRNALQGLTQLNP